MAPAAGRRSPIRLTGDEALRLTLARQGLLARAPGTQPGAAVERFGPLHAADHRTPYLSLLARLDGFALADLDRAWLAERLLDRRPAMRRTLHLVPTARLGDVVCSYGGPGVGEARLRAAGIAPAEAARFRAAVEAVLEREGGLELTGLKRGLPAELRVRAADRTRHGSVLAVVVRWMTEAGTLAVRTKADPTIGSPVGGWSRSPQTYERFAAAFGPLPTCDRDAADARLAGWYFEAHGPATSEDWVWWAGLPTARARAAFEAVRGGLVEVTVEGWPEPAYISPETLEIDPGAPDDKPESPVVRLLPYEDGALKAYHSTRSRFFDAETGERQQTSFGEVLPSVLVDGRVAGTWFHGVGSWVGARGDLAGRKRQGGEVVVVPIASGAWAELFVPADRAVRDRLEAELARVEAALAGVD